LGLARGKRGGWHCFYFSFRKWRMKKASLVSITIGNPIKQLKLLLLASRSESGGKDQYCAEALLPEKC
jgi:hypothetical protein